MYKMETVDQKKFMQLLDDFKFNAKLYNSPFTVKVSIDQKIIWTYDESKSMIILGGDENVQKNVLYLIDASGLSKLMTGFLEDNEEKEVSSPDWKNYFLQKTQYKYLIPDIGFIYSHYGSKVLSPLLGEELRHLMVMLPRVVLIDIEKRGNLTNDTSTKRLAIYAANEIDFLKHNTDFDILPSLESSLMINFSRKLERELINMWVRKEIHDSIKKIKKTTTIEFRYDTIVYLTNDLINALMAEAEGINVCYFNRLPQDAFKVDLTKLFDLIIVTSMIYGEVKLDFSAGDKVTKSYNVEGIWEGKAVSQYRIYNLKLVELINEM